MAMDVVAIVEFYSLLLSSYYYSQTMENADVVAVDNVTGKKNA